MTSIGHQINFKILEVFKIKHQKKNYYFHAFLIDQHKLREYDKDRKNNTQIIGLIT